MSQIFRCKETININDCKIEYYTWNHIYEGEQKINNLLEHYLVSQNWNKFIKKNSNTIDIGAHSGDTIIPLYIAGSDYGTLKTKVLAIEPNPIVREICELNAKSNVTTNVEIEVLSFAITDKDDINVVLFDHGNEMCNGGIIHEHFSEELKNKLNNIPNKKGVEVVGMTLKTICDKYFTKEETKNVSFIKIDTEGYDKEIIRSSKDFLNDYKPVIFMEWFDFYNNEESQDLFNVINDINYIPFNPVTLEVANVENKIWDLLIIHKEDIENLNKTKFI
jgi:FkbM family methyltransferase